MADYVQKIALIQCYIHHMKDVQVNIDVMSSMSRPDLVDKAYTYARAYFNR